MLRMLFTAPLSDASPYMRPYARLFVKLENCDKTTKHKFSCRKTVNSPDMSFSEEAAFIMSFEGEAPMHTRVRIRLRFRTC
jgi:hypothetical protein